MFLLPVPKWLGVRLLRRIGYSCGYQLSCETGLKVVLSFRYFRFHPLPKFLLAVMARVVINKLMTCGCRKRKQYSLEIRNFRVNFNFISIKKKIPIVCFTSYFVFSIAVLPHSPVVVYYHLLLRRETRIPGVAPFCFRIGIS